MLALQVKQRSLSLQLLLIRMSGKVERRKSSPTFQPDVLRLAHSTRQTIVKGA
jgi:hypothetical protein